MSSHLSGLEIFQINLHRSKDASYLLAKNLADRKTEKVIALIQEPYWFKGRIRCLGSAGKVLTCDQESRQRACVIARNLDAALIQAVSTGDLAVVRVVTDGDSPLIVASGYCAHDRESPPEEVRNLVSYCRGEGSNLLLGCDANAHNLVWGSSNDNDRGESLLSFILEEDLHIVNEGTEPTFVTVNRREVLDLTICNRGLIGRISKWRVSDETSLSDHRLIRAEISDWLTVTKWKRNPRSTNWDQFKHDLSITLNGFRGNYGNPRDLEVSELTVRKAIITAYENNCPLVKITDRTGSVRWTKELEACKRESRRLFNRAKKRGGPAWQEYTISVNKYKALWRKTHKDAWNALCSETRSVSDTAKIARILSDSMKGDLKFLEMEDGTFSETPKHTLELLMSKNFPDITFEELRPSHPVPGANRKNWSLAAKIVDVHKVRDVIESLEDYKAPGPDGVYPVLLKRGLSSLLLPLTGLFRGCIANSYTPSEWKKTKVTFIPKPGKKSYKQVKDFRPISLTSFLLKTLEKLVDRYLKSGPLLELPLHKEQHAYQTGRSTESALFAVVNHVEKQLDWKGIAIGLFLDIEGAFNRTSRAAIRRGAEEHGIPEDLINWILSTLVNRTLTTEWMGCKVTGTVSEGCPQGGILSPLLWNLVVDSLLRILNSSGVKAIGYADDIAILVRGQYEDDLQIFAQRALNKAVTWCVDNDLTINPDKVAAIVFTKRYKLKPIREMMIGTQAVPYTRETKYLGVILDSKLLWQKQLDTKCQKAIVTFWQCKRALGLKWGLGPAQILWIYSSIIVPRICYGALVWWPRVKLKTAQLALNKVQALFLRAACHVRRSTPMAAVRVVLDLPTLGLEIEKEAMRAASRLTLNGLWDVNSQAHYRLFERHLEDTWRTPWDCIPAQRIERKRYKIIIPERQEWAESFGPRHGQIWFTDGSKTRDGVGAGICGPKRQDDKSIRLHEFNTVFQAELLAIECCAKAIQTRGVRNETIWICSDSQASLKALDSGLVHSRVVLDTMRLLDEIAEVNRLTLTWIPGHSGWKGNERADLLARTATTAEPSDQKVGLPFQEILNQIDSLMEKKRKGEWLNSTGCNTAKGFLAGNLGLWGAECRKLSSRQLRLAIEILTGHGNLKKHKNTIGKVESPFCDRCKEDKEETSTHLLCDCPALTNARTKWLGPLLGPGDVRELTLRQIIGFSLEAGYVSTP